MKNEEKAPSDANKRGKVFGSGNTVHREDFVWTSEALNAIQVKFDCGESMNALQVKFEGRTAPHHVHVIVGCPIRYISQ